MIHPLDAHQMAAAQAECTAELSLAFNGLGVQLLADDPDILAGLAAYFDGLADNEAVHTRQRIVLLNRQADVSQVSWTPVKRKKVSPLGLKEAYVDTPAGRWIHKVRTGLVMLQTLEAPLVMGDLEQNLAQVVNFINNQFLNHYQRQGYLLGHAAAFDVHGRTTAIAAGSGGGKSTLMLRALEVAEARFLSNDRILFRPAGDQTDVLGLAKHPRVNPGTLLHSPRLVSILPEPERARFKAMTTSELWQVEQKYDVLIPQAYGPNKTALAGTLTHLVLLDWSLDSDSATRLSPVDVHSSPAVLEGLRKSPGPFFQQADGRFPAENSPAAEVYAACLAGVQVWQLTGAINFDRAIDLLRAEGVV